jgi:hypothetical protein
MKNHRTKKTRYCIEDESEEDIDFDKQNRIAIAQFHKAKTSSKIHV